MKSINPSDGIVPIARFKAHASRLIRKLRKDNEPIVITQNGEAAAVMVSPKDYERMRDCIPSSSPVMAVAEQSVPYRASSQRLDLHELPRDRILEIAARHGAVAIRVFGSVARGEARAGSDLDLLVDMQEGRSLLDLIGFEQELCDLLGTRVDVVTEEGLSGEILDRILFEAVEL